MTETKNNENFKIEDDEQEKDLKLQIEVNWNILADDAPALAELETLLSKAQTDKQQLDEKYKVFKK